MLRRCSRRSRGNRPRACQLRVLLDPLLQLAVGAPELGGRGQQREPHSFLRRDEVGRLLPRCVHLDGALEIERPEPAALARERFQGPADPAGDTHGEERRQRQHAQQHPATQCGCTPQGCRQEVVQRRHGGYDELPLAELRGMETPQPVLSSEANRVTRP